MTKNVMSVSKIPAELRRERESKRHIIKKCYVHNKTQTFRGYGGGNVKKNQLRQEQNEDIDLVKTRLRDENGETENITEATLATS